MTPRRRASGLLALLLALSAPGCGGEPPVIEHADEATQLWTCAMHPQIRQRAPGECPICGMDLVPVGANADVVTLSPRARTLAGLRTTEVRRAPGASAELRLLGRVEAAETSLRAVTAWFGGRVDTLLVKQTGERVRAGQVIARLYSPEVYAAHQDLLAAARQLEALSGGTPSSEAAARQALEAARRRLALLGFDEAELDAMARASEPTRSAPVRAAQGGTVLERLVTEGQTVQAGAPLLRLADLSEVWVQLDAFERDLPHLRVGQAVTLEVEALPGEVFAGRLDFIEPELDPVRRTASARVVVSDHDGQLRPGQFAEAVVSVEAADAPLVIPATAPLFTGRRSLVYVEQEEGRYAPRVVRLGARVGEHYPVLSGLVEGERVVSRGAFALDADLQIRGGASMMSMPGDAEDEAEPPSLSAAERDALAPTLTAYLELQRALAEDDLAAAQRAASRLVEVVEAVSLPAAAQAEWAPLAKRLHAHGAHVAHAADIEGAREGFLPLSQAIEGVLERLGNPLDAPVHVAFCPMAAEGAGARWVQQGEVVDNAYYGDAMRTCGEVLHTVAPDTTLSPEPEATGHTLVGGGEHAH
ncbi:MAG: efflux RND transporter periplasmic adaptor subunit [Alphaproteobacteria bacterium]|nr:efflux RND transporter periplasmic adaptor subunit [Alphaproteobacteria bacterium]